MLLKQAISGCDTGQVDGLSKQLIERLLAQKYLVKIEHPLIVCSGRQNNPYLQPLAYQALVKAVNARSQTLVINSCLRTIMQQYMLYVQKLNSWCGIRAAAVPGQSNHQSGLSIDIEDAPKWKNYLAAYKWAYLGDFDPMHFDFKGGGYSLSKLQITEFQKLWNENNVPQLKVDGRWGAKTEAAIANSPCQGFGNPKVLKRGDYSPEVATLQKKLAQRLNISLLADSHFGSATEKALREFQQQNGLVVDGVASAKTLLAIG
jgi:hypothetical protein